MVPTCCYPDDKHEALEKELQKTYGSKCFACIEGHGYCDRSAPCESCKLLQLECDYPLGAGKEAVGRRSLGIDDKIPLAFYGFYDLKKLVSQPEPSPSRKRERQTLENDDDDVRSRQKRATGDSSRSPSQLSRSHERQTLENDDDDDERSRQKRATGEKGSASRSLPSAPAQHVDHVADGHAASMSCPANSYMKQGSIGLRSLKTEENRNLFGNTCPNSIIC